MGLRVLGALLGEDRAAEPVPVRRPGVWVIGVDARGVWAEISTASYTGRTNIGLKLEVKLKVRHAMGLTGHKTYRNASHRTSIHDTQLETIISPALGLQASLILLERLFDNQ